MKTTLKEILQSIVLSDSQVVAGENGQDNVVLSINVIDAPRGLKYVKQGTLIITSGYEWLIKPSDQYNLIHQMNSLGAAGLALKPQLFDNRLPESTKRLADELAFPIIFLGDTLPYADFISFFHNNVFYRPVSQFISIERVYEMLRSSAENEDWYSVGKTLYTCIDRPLYIRGAQVIKNFGDHDFQSISCDIPPRVADDDSPASDEWHVRTFIQQNDETDAMYLGCQSSPESLFPFALYVFGGTEPFTRMELTLINFVVRCLESSNSNRTRKTIQLQEKILSELLEHETPANIHRELQTLGKQIAEDYMVCLFSTDLPHELFPQFLSSVHNIINDHDLLHSTIIGNYSGHLTLLLPTENNSEKWINLICANFSQLLRSDTVVSGFGNLTTLRNLSTSYRQAIEALFWADLRGAHSVISYGSIGFLQLLSKDNTQEKINYLFRKYFENILTYDDAHHSDLLLTLETHIHSFWNFTTTARVLHLDPNTVRYRINKIQDLSNIDLQNFEERLSIELALYLYRLLK